MTASIPPVVKHGEPPDPLAHRRLTGQPLGSQPFAGSDLFARLGGQATVDRLVDLLYDGFEADPALRPLFPRDLTGGRAGQKMFFTQWLGGSPRYAERSCSGLVHRHESVPITRAVAERWLHHLQQALTRAVAGEADRGAILEQASALAWALVNEADTPAAHQPGAKARGGPHRRRAIASCGVAARPLSDAVRLAQRGDAAGLAAALDQAPGLLATITFAARLMQAAALAGRAEIVQLLVGRGVDVHAPHYLPVAVTGRSYERVIFVTPLCAARLRHRAAAEQILLGAGAHDDVFTAALLGDLTRLRAMLATGAALAHACDPAADVLNITPLDHAVAGGQADALRLLLGHARSPLRFGGRALRGAVEKGDVPMAGMLLAHGADPATIGVGRWVLHPELAPLLASRGASVGSSGAWIGACCTGNQGRKDDPDYVRALLRHGAGANDRRIGDHRPATGVQALAATGLHYAAKAGFEQTVEVLLEHGADPLARDTQGRTPLDWLEGCPPSAATDQIRRLLTSRRPGQRTPCAVIHGTAG
jgi:truncated hemoglobin YjbI/ankyrin repeat protein